MTKKAFEGIKQGLKEAIDYVNGDTAKSKTILVEKETSMLKDWIYSQSIISEAKRFAWVADIEQNFQALETDYFIWNHALLLVLKDESAAVKFLAEHGIAIPNEVL